MSGKNWYNDSIYSVVILFQFLQIELSLCKIAALCDDQENVAEIADLSEQIRVLQESLHGKERNDNHENNMF